jgi:hypothetical protein
MKILDKRTTTATKEFGELPIGAVFEFPMNDGHAEWFGICMKINSADRDNNAIDLEDCHLFSMPPNVKVCELNAHLVIEGR